MKRLMSEQPIQCIVFAAISLYFIGCFLVKNELEVPLYNTGISIIDDMMKIISLKTEANGYIDRPSDCTNYLEGYSDNFCEFLDEKGNRCTYSIEISWVMDCMEPPRNSKWIRGDRGNIHLEWHVDEGYEIAPEGFTGYGLRQEL
jgi:hypothetical protein